MECTCGTPLAGMTIPAHSATRGVAGIHCPNCHAPLDTVAVNNANWNFGNASCSAEAKASALDRAQAFEKMIRKPYKPAKNKDS
mgnify:CR=1 FL=1